MEPERWRQIEDVFQAALDCEPERRAALLESACGGDPSLRQEVESLLASYEEGAFTEAPAFEDAVKLLEKDHSLAGRRIGPYLVIREIGHGGMGAVYLAARADEAFQKQVAIKLIKRGLDTVSIVQHFHSERQILASLDHPNITRLLDGGTSEDGLPYFVMEYIQGEPIDAYCNARKLNIVDRLRLFRSVCAAVHYAHQNLVIHRDIKPGNVLVTSDGVPRLLDFGIAKLLHPADSPAAVDRTMTVARLMTPDYASPEQVRGEPVTTASDVYSLGVLLYRLLTGHRPYRITGMAPADLERAICEEQPVEPSSAIGRVDEAARPQSVSATREGTPDKLRRRLRGDLDNIVLMAMRKEPRRRYGSAEQLSEDIRRHLDGLPVIARPDTARYRAAKFVARHRAGVVAAALLFVTLAAGIAATLREARIAAAARDRARIETAKTERINAFLQDMLSYSNPSWTSPNLPKDPNVKVSEVVEEAVKRAEAELAGQPEVLAEVQRTIGGVYSAQGRWKQAEPLLRAALGTDLRLYGPDHRETATTSHALAMVLRQKGNTAEAESLLRKVLDIERREVRRGHPDFAALFGTLSDLGTTLGDKGDNKGAEACFREALRYAPNLTGKQRGAVAEALNQLASILYTGGDLNEVERLVRMAIDEYRKLPAGRYTELAESQANLGTLLYTKGRYAEAEPLIREALEINRKVLGNEHFSTAGCLVALADVLYAKGDYRGAEDAVRESLGIVARTTPKGTLGFSAPLIRLGLTLNKTGRSREAEKYLREALAIRTRLLPAGHQITGGAESALGECLTTQKRYAEAEPLLVHSYAVYKSSLGEHDPRTLNAARRLVTAYESWGKAKEAERYRAVLPPGANGSKVP